MEGTGRIRICGLTAGRMLRIAKTLGFSMALLGVSWGGALRAEGVAETPARGLQAAGPRPVVLLSPVPEAPGSLFCCSLSLMPELGRHWSFNLKYRGLRIPVKRWDPFQRPKSGGKPASYLQGRSIRIKLMTPVLDGSSVPGADYYGSKTSFLPFPGGAKPYHLMLSWGWFGVGQSEFGYHIKPVKDDLLAGTTYYRMGMQMQEIGITIGLQRRFFIRRSGYRVIETVVYRSNWTFGVGSGTKGSLELSRLNKTYRTESFKANSYFIYYGWEFLESPDIGLEWALGIRQNKFEYGPPTQVGGTETLDFRMKGSVYQYVMGVGVGF